MSTSAASSSDARFHFIKAGQGKPGWHPGITPVSSRFLIAEEMTNRFRLKLNSVPAGVQTGTGHGHRVQEHAVYVLSGRGEISLDHGPWHLLEPGDAAFIGPGVHHNVRTVGDEPFVSLMLDVPPEDDDSPE